MRHLFVLLASVFILFACAPEEKEIYIPKDFQGMDLNDPESEYSYERMALTENFAIFWEKGFGNDLSAPPALEGQDMSVDIENLKEKLETYYDYFYNTLGFAKEGSKCDRYRMLVIIRYSLEGTAYGGDYDGQIGALWVTPNRIQDKKLNCIAHELGHSFQSQITCDGEGEAWGGCGFFEMTSQWMLWQVNPGWVHDESYHWDSFTQKCHKAYLHLTNIYHSPYILEHWGEKRGLKHIAELYRQGKRGEDPAMTYMRVNGLSQKEFCDEMFEASRRIVNLDYKRAWEETRPYANRFSTKMTEGEDGWRHVSQDQCPEDYGFNAVALPVPQAGDSVTVGFKGEGHRYGIVAVCSDGQTIYGKMHEENEGTMSFKTPSDASLTHLWLVVMGAPSEHVMGSETQWPYAIKVFTND
ncbi:MAG: hypothetical protein IJV84_06395 [Bacteroidales bacterium]|nr:hypothetical protein [Bacteroidales bacterium]